MSLRQAARGVRLAVSDLTPWGGEPDEVKASPVDDDLANALVPPDDVERAITVRPNRESDGIENGAGVLQSMHRNRVATSGEPSGAADAFELRFTNDLMNIQYVPGSERRASTLNSELDRYYPDSMKTWSDPDLLEAGAADGPSHADAAEADQLYAAGAKVTTTKYTLKPIKHIGLEGFHTDPFGSITGEMANFSDVSDEFADVCVQVMLQPATQDWTQGVNGGQSIGVVESLMKEPQIEKTRRWLIFGYRKEIPPSKNKKKAAELIRDLDGHDGWWLNIRILAVASNPDLAERRVENVGAMFGKYYEGNSEQNLRYIPQNGSRLRRMAENAAARKYVNDGIVQPRKAAAGLAHVPDDSINNHAFEWVVGTSDSGLPAGIAQPEDYPDATGYLTDDIPTTTRGQILDDSFEWDYAYDPNLSPDARDLHAGEEIGVERDPDDIDISEDDDERYFEGARPRALLRNLREYPDNPTFVGIDSNGRDVPLFQEQRPRHLVGLGATGNGKSTTATRINVGDMDRGAGLISIDPGGEDTYQMLMSMDPDRFDDVHIMDVGSDFSEWRVGFNLLDTVRNPDEPGFDQEVDGKLGVIMPLLGTDEYRRMKRVGSHLFRGLIEASYLDADQNPDPSVPDSEKRDGQLLGEGVRELLDDDVDADKNYTIEDAETIAGSKENREAWFEMLQNQGLDHLLKYGKQFAEMDDDDGQLEPFLGRLKEWTESPNTRAMIAMRDSPLSIPDIVLNQEILLVMCHTSNEDVRKMVSSTVSRMVWQTILSMPSPKEQRRMERQGVELPGPMTHETFDGYPETNLSIDEGHSVVNDTMDLGTMMAEGRKRNLRISFYTQQVRQLTQDQRDDLANSAHVLAWNPGINERERSAIAAMFPDVTKDELATIDQYSAYVLAPDEAGNVPDESFIAEMYPPVSQRTRFDDVAELMEQKEREDGVRKGHEDESGLSSNFDDPRSRGQGGAGGLDDDGIALTDDRAHAILESIFAVAATETDAAPKDLINDQIVEWDDVVDRLSAHLRDDDLGPQQRETLTAKALTNGLVAGGTFGERVGLTEDGAKQLLLSGEAGSAGKLKHQLPLIHVMRDLTRNGYLGRIPEQDGTELADLVARVPMETGGATRAEADAAARALENDHPDLFALGGEYDLAVEYERSTRSRVEQIGQNLREAMEADEPLHGLLVVPDDNDSDPLADARRIDEKMREPYVQHDHAPDDADRQFYLRSPLCPAEGDAETTDWRICVPGDISVEWVMIDGGVHLRDGDTGETVVSWPSVEAFRDRDASDAPAIRKKTNDGDIVVREDGETETYATKKEFKQSYTAVKEPFIYATPDPERWSVAILSRDGVLNIYDAENDTAVPLSDLSDYYDARSMSGSENDSDATDAPQDGAVADGGADGDQPAGTGAEEDASDGDDDGGDAASVFDDDLFS